MLGEQLAQFTGKVTGTRMIPGDDYRYLKMEVSYQQGGKLFGADATDTGTYTVFERIPGQLYGEGQGFLGTADGEGAIWNGHGIGHMTGQGMGMAFRFSVAYQAGGTGKLSRLKDCLIIGEHEADAQGNITTKFWEWK